MLIPSYGIEAAAWVTLATELVVVSLSTVTVLRRIEMRLSPAPDRPRPLAAALAALGRLGAAPGRRRRDRS